MSNLETIAPTINEGLENEVAARENYTLDTALTEALKQASYSFGGLARGLREVTRCIDKRQALFCVLAKDCDRSEYAKLIKALCKEANIECVEVESKTKLGEMVGLAKYDKQMRTRKVQKCSCCAVRSGVASEDSAALTFVLNSFAKDE